MNDHIETTATTKGETAADQQEEVARAIKNNAFADHATMVINLSPEGE